MTTRTEAADLARTVLADSEDEHPAAMYLLNVREARTLANAALAACSVEELAGALEREAEKEREKPNRDYFDYGWDDACTVAAHRIRAALNGETRD